MREMFENSTVNITYTRSNSINITEVYMEGISRWFGYVEGKKKKENEELMYNCFAGIRVLRVCCLLICLVSNGCLLLYTLGLGEFI